MRRPSFRRSLGGRLARPSPGDRFAELFEVKDAWPATAIFPAPYVYRPSGVDRQIMDLDPLSAHRAIVLPPVLVNDIPGASIRVSGAIETAEGRLLLESVKRPGHLFRSPEPAHRPARVVVRAGIGTTISLPRRLPNYFHWVIDMLPRLYALEQFDDQVELVVPVEVPPFVDDLLRLVVSDRMEVVRCPRGHALRYDTVRLSPFTTVWGHGLMRPEVLAWLRSRLLGARSPGQPDRRIYVRRVGTAARAIVNEDELIATLAPFGIESVRPELLDVADQLSLFAAASLVVGPCGAGLTNMVAASAGAAVVDINPGGLDGYPSHPSFWSLAKACGHRYVVVPHASRLHQPSFAADVDRVRRAVELALERPSDPPGSAIVSPGGISPAQVTGDGAGAPRTW